MRSLRRQGRFRARAGLSSGAHPHRVHEPSAEPGMGLQVAAKFALDGSGLKIAGTPPSRIRGPHASLLDPFEQGFAGGDGGEDQRHAGRKRRLDMLDRAGPFDLPERRVDGDELVSGDEARQQDGHGLGVLASRGRESDEGAAFDHLVAVGRDGDVDSG